MSEARSMTKDEWRAKLARDTQGVPIRLCRPQERDMFDPVIPWQREQHSRKVYHAYAGHEPRRREPRYGDLLEEPTPRHGVDGFINLWK